MIYLVQQDTVVTCECGCMEGVAGGRCFSDAGGAGVILAEAEIRGKLISLAVVSPARAGHRVVFSC